MTVDVRRFAAALSTAFLAIVIDCICTSATQAQDRVALVIGNGKYIHSGPLRNPPNDAREIAKVLREIGFDEVSEGLDLSRNDMERFLRDFLRKSASARVALLFYAGHGMQVDGRNYLIPVDAKLETVTDLNFGTIEVDRILASLDDPARATIVILDACRDNPLARSFAASLGGTRSAAVGTGLAAYSSVGTGTLIAFATAPGHVALERTRADRGYITLHDHSLLPLFAGELTPCRGGCRLMGHRACGTCWLTCGGG